GSDMSAGIGAGSATGRDQLGMRSYWDSKARENAMYFIHNTLDYTQTDEGAFWESGPDNLERTLAPFSRKILAADRVVEIGCGIGRITRAIAMRAAHVVGVDVSHEMIQRARLALADLDNVDLMVGNGLDLGGVDDASVDVAYSFIVFQHIPDPSITCGYIREIGRVLRPGGWTVFQVSELPEIHRRDTWVEGAGITSNVRQVLSGALRRRPRGCLAPQWLGSAVDRAELLGALDDGGLVFDDSVGDGSQFCLVNAHRQ
ncbi:MAG: class I SAM-dependent methyltransferase, partial [Acidimicrobiales bacterium]